MGLVADGNLWEWGWGATREEEEGGGGGGGGKILVLAETEAECVRSDSSPVAPEEKALLLLLGPPLIILEANALCVESEKAGKCIFAPRLIEERARRNGEKGEGPAMGPAGTWSRVTGV